MTMAEPTPPDPSEADRVAAIAERATALRRRLAAAGGDHVEIVAVTKGFGPLEVRGAARAGLTAIGENYAQELVAKYEAVRPDESEAADGPSIEWHFIGRLQRNKVKRLAGLVDVWQSVDRAVLVDEIAKRAPGATVFVQVDVSGEPAKGGCPPDHLADLVQRGRDLGLRVDGVMAIGPTGPPEAAADPFRRLVDQADELGLARRSIGMSTDLEVAVAAGSTMVRVGRDLFGPRPPRPG